MEIILSSLIGALSAIIVAVILRKELQLKKKS